MTEPLYPADRGIQEARREQHVGWTAMSAHTAPDSPRTEAGRRLPSNLWEYVLAIEAEASAAADTRASLARLELAEALKRMVEDQDESRPGDHEGCTADECGYAAARVLLTSHLSGEV